MEGREGGVRYHDLRYDKTQIIKILQELMKLEIRCAANEEQSQKIEMEKN